MERPVKKGTVIIEPGKPLQFNDAISIERPPVEDLKSANFIGDAIKTYLRSARELLKGKYACYASFMPQHLLSNCSTFVVQCSDGILVRHDAASESGAVLRVAQVKEGLADIAPKFSEF